MEWLTNLEGKAVGLVNRNWSSWTTPRRWPEDAALTRYLNTASPKVARSWKLRLSRLGDHVE